MGRTGCAPTEGRVRSGRERGFDSLPLHSEKGNRRLVEMPDITKAQIVALVQAVLALVIAFGVDLTEAQQTAIIGLAGAVAIVLPLADAIIRNGRSRIYAESVKAMNATDDD